MQVTDRKWLVECLKLWPFGNDFELKKSSIITSIILLTYNVTVKNISGQFHTVHNVAIILKVRCLLIYVLIADNIQWH